MFISKGGEICGVHILNLEFSLILFSWSVVFLEVFMSMITEDLYGKGISGYQAYYVVPYLTTHFNEAVIWICPPTGENDYLILNNDGYRVLNEFGLPDVFAWHNNVSRNIIIDCDRNLVYHDEVIISGAAQRSVVGCVRYGDILVMCVNTKALYVWLFIDFWTEKLLGYYYPGCADCNSLVARLILVLSVDLNFNL